MGGWVMRPVELRGVSAGCIRSADGRGVVLCNSFGYEQLSVHRVWRGLADQFAAAGLPALRFDWHGSGNSVGDYADPERVRAWLESVRGAVALLRAETGVSEVALVGLRLGATLATLVAEELGDVESLALLAPVVSGKAYVREMRALSAFARSAAPSAGHGRWRDGGGGFRHDCQHAGRASRDRSHGDSTAGAGSSRAADASARRADRSASGGASR